LIALALAACSAAAEQPQAEAQASGQQPSATAPAAGSSGQQNPGVAGASGSPAAPPPPTAPDKSSAVQAVPGQQPEQPTTSANPPGGDQPARNSSATPSALSGEEKKTAPADTGNGAATSPAADKNTASHPASPDKPEASPAPGISPNSSEYTIGDGDMLAINVYKEPEVSRELTVRSDGKISLPLINGDIQATGLTPEQLRVEIVQKLRAVIEIPEVTVIVRESRSRTFIVLGQVMKPGSFPLNHPMTMLDAIAEAGGFQPFHNQKKIIVLRKQPDGSIKKFLFNYDKAVKTGDPLYNPAIEPGDKIVVPN
jgi:polysaccharide export outer membrane protein